MLVPQSEIEEKGASNQTIKPLISSDKQLIIIIIIFINNYIL